MKRMDHIKFAFSDVVSGKKDPHEGSFTLINI